MAIHPLSARKILRTVFKTYSDETYPTESEQIEKLKELYRELKVKLASFKKLKIEPLYNRKQLYYNTHKIAIEMNYEPRHDIFFTYRQYDTLTILFKGNQLLVEAGYGEAPFQNTDQVVEYFHEVDKKRDQVYKNKSKKNKLKKLKEEAVLSHVKSLCKKLKLQYNIERYHLKMKLSLRLDNKYMIEIDIPYNKFQDILQDLEFAIMSAITLYNQGLFIKISNNKHGDYFWHSPDKINTTK